MAKRKAKHSASTAKRIPPSVPKCVKRCADGYCTDYFNDPKTSGHIAFKFVKTSSSYLVYRKSDNADARWICMSTDISIAPSTRVLFENLTTLHKAITAAETWLNAKLPDIR